MLRLCLIYLKFDEDSQYTTFSRRPVETILHCIWLTVSQRHVSLKHWNYADRAGNVLWSASYHLPFNFGFYLTLSSQSGAMAISLSYNSHQAFEEFEMLFYCWHTKPERWMHRGRSHSESATELWLALTAGELLGCCSLSDADIHFDLTLHFTFNYLSILRPL